MQVQSDMFVAREKELALFLNFIQPGSETRILAIHTNGAGGIGKTQLILRMHEQCKELPHVICPENPDKIIDFYNTLSRSKIGIMQQIATNFGPENFLNYNKQVKRFYNVHKMGKEVILAELEQSFASDFDLFSQKMKAEKKIIAIFFDTYEAIQGTSISNKGKTKAKPTDFSIWLETFLFPVLSQNSRLIIAGRYKLKNIGPDHNHKLTELELSPFTLSETEKFWKACQPREKLKQLIESENIKNQLYQLSSGRPVLLALLVDWIVYERNPLSPGDLLNTIEKKTGKITSYPSEEQKQIFEKTLIQRVAGLMESEDIAIIYMAFAYRRMTPDQFTYLTGTDIEKSRMTLIDNLRPLSFIKYKTDDIILLHDEMRDLVNRYWWDEQDKYKENRKKIAEKLIAYYDDVIKKTEPSLEKDILFVDRLYYLLFSDPETGLKTFIKEYDHNLEHFRIDFCNLLLQEISRDDFINDFSEQTNLKIALRRIRWYNEQYLSHDALSIIQRECDRAKQYKVLYAEFIYERGIARTWINEFSAAINDFECAERKFRELNNFYRSAWAYNWMGYAQLRNGEFEKAEKTLLYSINEFLKLPGPDRTPHTYAGISNAYSNLNVALRHSGQYEEAVNFGEIAGAIAEEKEYTRELTRYLNALAETFSTAGKTFDARKTFNRALKLLKSVSDPLLKTRVLAGLGLLSYQHNEYVYMLEYYERGEEQKEIFQKYRGIFQPEMSKLNKAAEILRSVHPGRELADVYFYLGEACAVNEDWEEAIAYFQKSVETAGKVANTYREMAGLVALMVAYYYAGAQGAEENGREPFEREIRKCRIRIAEIPANYHDLAGKMRIVLGDFACEKYMISKSPDRLKEAVKNYILGCSHMYLFNSERFSASMRILLRRLNRMFTCQPDSKVSAETVFLLRDIWYYDLKDTDVCRRHRDKFDEILKSILVKLEVIETETNRRRAYIRELRKKTDRCIQQGKGHMGFAVLYGEIHALLQDRFGSAGEKAEAYRVLARAYRLTDNYFESHKNFELALDISQDSDDQLLKVRILTGYGANLYRSSEYALAMRQYCREEIKENVAHFMNHSKNEIKEAQESFEKAEKLMQEIEASDCFPHLPPDEVAWTRGKLEFRWAEFLLIINEANENPEIETLLNNAIKNAEKNDDTFRKMEIIETLLAYYYYSGQWENKTGHIRELQEVFEALNESMYSPLLLARIAMIKAHVKYDMFIDFINKHKQSPANEKAILEESFTHYILATRYAAEYSDKYFHEALRILLLRIAHLPVKSVETLSEIYNTHFLNLKRPTGLVADRAYQLVEQFMRVRSEAL